jgi:hypothetical protein
MWVNIGEKVMVTESPEMMRLLEISRNLAATKSTVLIMGESGTGKELLARWIHQHSARSNGPFVNSLDTKKALSLEPTSPNPENLSWPAKAHFCSMKSQSFPSCFRENSSE